MKIQGFLIFHLNLAFSSIPVAERISVIKKCYWPLFHLIEKTGIKIGIELTGWTLNQINILDVAWVGKFRSLLNEGKCELIGSGWSQLIGPLVPYDVNRWNQQLGIDAYKSLLGIRPKVALINEMAFSSSMVDVYSETGYEGFIMDRDNIRLALEIEKLPLSETPTHAKGNKENILGVLWSDSILFQRFQRVIHRDISIMDYMSSIEKKIKLGETLLPIYTNDAEIFNYRPGRFTTESELKHNDEWARLELICLQLGEKFKLEWVSPNEAISNVNDRLNKKVSRLSSIAHPIPVKKQPKYNVNRWAITGRDNLWINTSCHRIAQYYITNFNENPNDWRQLCEFWASDLRTHISIDRWQEATSNIESILADLQLFETIKSSLTTETKTKITNERYSIEKDCEGIYLTINTVNIQITLNARRGLTVKKLSFKSQDFNPVIGTIDQGHFSSIHYAADYYSGGVLVEIPGKRKRITDLEWINPIIEENESQLIITAAIPMETGSLRKDIIIDLVEEKIRFRYEFNDFEKPLGVIRVGTMTFLPDFMNDPILISCKVGGNIAESFNLNSNFDHGAAVSSMVSSTTSLGATDGTILFTNPKKTICVRWDPGQCAAVPLLKNFREEDKSLTRLSFSLSELDDTSKTGGRLIPFEMEISTK